MPIPVYFLTVQEVHKDYNSLTDQIRAKYEQLDSGEYGSVDTPSIQSWSLWIGKSTCSCEPTMQETEPMDSKGIIQAYILQALKTPCQSKFMQWLGYGGCSFVPVDM